MSKLTERLRKLNIYNPYEFVKCGNGRIFIEYQKFVPGRAGVGIHTGYHVCGIEFKVDPNAHWTLYGDKCFSRIFNKTKEQAREEAFKWAEEKFGIKEWAKMPFRECWCAKEVYDNVMKLLKEMENECKD